MPTAFRRSALRRACSGIAVAAMALSPWVALAAPPAVAAETRVRAAVIDGPDVASYQHPNGARIHWRKVAAAHNDFAIVKATEGTSYRNPWFRRDYGGARDAGLVRGSYHFAQPAYPVVATARRQAHYFVHALGSSVSTGRTLPPALDLEFSGGLSRPALVLWAQTFLLETRKLTGRTPMVYTYPAFWASALGDPVALARYPLWMANYDGGGVDPSAMLWQYTSGAKVAGIQGSVDMSRFLADPATWSSMSDGRATTPWPAAAPGPVQQVAAHGGDSAATVSWLPGDTGSSLVSSYRVTASPGGASAVVDGSHFTATVDGLDNGTAYTFTVTATNVHGPGIATAPTASVTPMVPTLLSVSPMPITTYGDDAVVRLRLTRPDRDAPLPGRPVVLESRTPATGAAPAGPWVVQRTLTTGSSGWTGVHLTAPVHSVDLRFTFTGPAGWRQARTAVPVVVHNGVTMRLSRTRVRAGHEVTMTGHITPAVAGVKVLREGYYHHAWHVWAATRTSETGRYEFRFTPTVKTTDVYRTVVAGFDGRAGGVSTTRQLTVH